MQAAVAGARGNGWYCGAEAQPAGLEPGELQPGESPAAAPPAPELAAFLAARMCHDFISPASAIVSGLDLLDDPSAQDMRDDAMNLIASSAASG